MARTALPIVLILALLATGCAPAARRSTPESRPLTRAEWGARDPVLPMRPHEVRRITIHHTATLQRPERALADKMAALQRFSQEESPLADGRVKPAWPDVPYHFYVDHVGRVAEGREVRFAGDTNTSYDPTGHLLIVLEGNFELERPGPEQWSTLRRLVVELAGRYGVPAEQVDGHRDHAATLCPGQHLYDLLPALREEVRSAAPRTAPDAAGSATLPAPPPPGPSRTILAVGAHAGDMELTSGAVLIRQQRRGDRVVLLHLTLGEGGNPRLPPAAYAEQKRREATEAAGVMGAEVRFGPYRDGEIPNDEEARRYVADVIRQVKPTHLITHWERSLHKDHAATHALVKDAVLLASLAGVETGNPPHRGVRAVYYAENWEDAEGFRPYLYVDVGEEWDRWREAVSRYEFVGGQISSFRYLDYYDALSVVRGAETRRPRAVAFDVDPYGKRRVLDSLP